MQRDCLPGMHAMSLPTRPDRIGGGLMGLLVGDALGVPYEFHAPEELPSREAIDMTPPAGFARSHLGTPPGTWSDDGAQALALLASLLACNRFDAQDFAARLIAWHGAGDYAVDRRVFDCGLQTRLAIHALRSRVPPLEAGPSNEEHNGNGSLMRVLPLALWHPGDDAALVADAHAQSRLTHGHVRSQVCCALYCLWARQLLDAAHDGGDDGWDEAIARLGHLYRGQEAYLNELEFVTRPEHGRRVRASGYVLHTLWAARHALREGGYEQAVRAAIAFGDDTDTTACVAGGLAGLRGEVQEIPARWIAALRGRGILRPLLDRLLGH